jgi:hypothetical protein
MHKEIKFLTFLFSICCSTSLYAQAPDTLWTKTYGGPSMDKSYSVQQTSAGGYIIAGYYTYYETTEDVYLVKTDPQGNVTWQKTYGGTYQDIAHSVQQTTDGGYIVVGSTISFGPGYHNIWLLKTDANGDTLWTKIYGWDNADNEGYAVQQTSDGGYIIGGWTIHNMLLIKTDANGDTLWLREYGTDHTSYGFSLQQTDDSGYITVGSYCPETFDFYIVKTDQYGDTTWSTIYGGFNYDRLYSVKQTSDGGYIAAGGFNMQTDNRQTPDACLMKMDSLGGIEWVRTYGEPYGDDVAFSVIETEDHEYVVTGRTHSDTSYYFDTFLLKTDSLGNEIWSTTFIGNGEDWSHCVESTTDGGYIIAGWLSASNGYSDVWLIKTAPDTIGINEDVVNYHTTNLKIHPNPFCRNVNIEINRSKGVDLTELMVYDIEGRLVKDLCIGKNHIRIIWDGCDNSGKQLPAGVYFLHVKQKDFSDVKKLILLR